MDNMSNDFGELLLECRTMAGFTQKQLAERIKSDGSIISRLENNAPQRPNKPPISNTMLQEIVVAFSTANVPADKLDQLCASAGYFLTPTFKEPVSDRIVETTHLIFEKLGMEERNLLRDDIDSILEIDKKYFDAVKTRKQKKWDEAANTLIAVREEMDRRIQHWYLRVEQELGDCLYSSINFSEAMWHYRSALMSAIQLEDEQKRAEILIRIGNIYRRHGGSSNCDEARKCYNEAGSIFVALEDKIREADCLRKSAGAWIFEGRPDKAESLCDESLNICETNKYNKGIYKALQHKAWIYSLTGRWEEAIRLCQEAINKIEDGWDLIKGLRYLGDIYRSAGLYEDARTAYQKALELCEPLVEGKPSHTKGLIELGLAKVCLEQEGREAEAKQYIEAGLKDYGGQGEDIRAIDFYVEQGRLLLKLKRFQEARPLLELATQQYRDLENILNQARTLALLCELDYQERGPNYFDKIQMLAKFAADIDNGLINLSLAKIDFIRGKALANNKDFPEAVKAWHSASAEALGFNISSFVELSKLISFELTQGIMGMDLKTADGLCESYIKSWEDTLNDKMLKLADRKAVLSALGEFKHLQEEYKTIRASSNS
jgi:tetratricopeptide (TPR) repeat protein